MLKKISIYLFFLFSFFVNTAFAASTPVETVFSDIDKNYEYYNELQDLYDRWAIYPDEDGKFNPYKLLTRDEYVSIALEVSCKRCTRPNTPIDLINTYSEKLPYYDVQKNSKYFYCISLADDMSYVRWYDISYTCADWTYKLWEKPFCPANNITLEEAVSVILRTSNIFTIWDNSFVIQDIRDWKITNNLSTDITPKNTDWSPYTFYWYLRKALDYMIEEYDSAWNKKVYKLLELQDWKIYPKRLVTKEDFLIMAYIALKSNGCSDNINNNLALNFWIFDKSCNQSTQKCDIAPYNKNEDTFDFIAEVWWFCQLWIDEVEWYVWRFLNEDTWDEIIKKWKYLNDFTIPTAWNWIIYLTVTDKCWNSTQEEESRHIWDYNNNQEIVLNVSMDADPIEWFVSLFVKFKSYVSGGKPPYYYDWSFWDDWVWNKKDEENVYKNIWNYKVKLIVTDSLWNKWEKTASIKVKPRDWDDDGEWVTPIDCTKDSDNDWLNDCDDRCVAEKWDEENYWCPIFEVMCWTNCDCPNWYICNDLDQKSCEITWVCVPSWDDYLIDLSDCLNNQWLNNIIWNASCASCPCDNSLDFLSKMRKCDLLIPAITSPDSKKVYSKWEFYEIR